MITTKSKIVKAVGYDAATQVMEVVLAGERRYRYFGVPEDVYVAMMASESIGAAFNMIKRSYQYERVEEPKDDDPADADRQS